VLLQLWFTRAVFHLHTESVGDFLWFNSFAHFSYRSSHQLFGGGVAEWFRALDLKSGGSWFKSSTLLLSGFVLGSPEFNSSTALCK